MGFSRNSTDTLPVYKKRLAMALWFISILAIWLLVWFAPWQAILCDLPWLKLGMTLAIFMIPGISLYGLLADRNSIWVNRITFGFVISHLLIALAGTMGRIFHVSFDLIRNLMMVLGIVLLLFTLYPTLSRGLSLRMGMTTLKEFASLWPLGLVTILVILIVIQREFSDDDLSYLAFLTNTQYSAHLSFSDIFFGLTQPVTSRFWLMSAPFAQALLADLSKIPGLLILSGYYEPFLIIIAILCWYGLARTMRLSHQAASVSVVLQILFLLLLSEYLHPGAPFFHQLSADKATATFILVPIFIQSEIVALREPTRNNLVLFLLCGISLTFMHPIALAYAVFIGGLMMVFDTDRDNFRTRLIPLVVILAALLPQIILRFIGTRVEENVPYGLDVILSQNGIENMITLWRGTQFYGFNPHILEMTFPYSSRFPFLEPVLKWAWLVVPTGALIFAIQKRKQSEIARYILSAFVLCALAGIPLTGWIFGYFLSAWALERAVWLFPFGPSAVFLLLSIREETGFGRHIGNWIKELETKVNVSSLPLVFSTLFTSFMLLLFIREHRLPDLQKFETNIRRFSDIAQVGRYLDRQIPQQAFVMGSDALNDFIPGISSKAKVITFRTSDFFSMSLFPVDEIKQRISDRQTIFSETTSPEVKLDLLKKYDVQFIVLQRADRDLFADLLASYPSQTKMEKVGRFFVIEIH